MSLPTIAAVNRTNTEYWKTEGPLVQRRLADEFIAAEAFRILNSEMQRGVPVRSQTILEEALDRSEKFRINVLSSQGAKGRRARKTDSLQEFMMSMLLKAPDISEAQLRCRIESEARPGFIEDVDTDDFSYLAHGGRSKTVKWTALKDRLSRAKRKMRSRKAVSAN